MDFGDCAAREIEIGDAGRERVLRGLFAEAQDAGESAVENGLEGGGRHDFRFFFSCTELCSRTNGGVNQRFPGCSASYRT